MKISTIFLSFLSKFIQICHNLNRFIIDLFMYSDFARENYSVRLTKVKLSTRAPKITQPHSILKKLGFQILRKGSHLTS